MKLVALLLTTTLVSTTVAQYGYGPAYPYPGHGGGYEFPAPAPFASTGYQYVTSGFSRPHHSLGHTPQFSIAKVKSHQNPLGYQYSVHESGPYHHKYHHQTATTQTHYPAYPVIAAATPIPAGIPLTAYAPGIPSYAYAGNHIPSKAIVSHGHGPPHTPSGYFGYPPAPEGHYGLYPGGIPLAGGGPPLPPHGGHGGPMYSPDYGF